MTKSPSLIAWTVLLALLGCMQSALADTTPTLFDSFAGNVNFIGTAKTRRTQSNAVNACSVESAGTSTSATLAGLPSGATVLAAYLYWAGSGSTPDYTVTFEGNTVNADANRQYTATYSDMDYFSGVADVTSVVAAKGNGSYSLKDLTVNSGGDWCDSEAVLAGWSLLVIYSHASEPYRVVNVYEGFQSYRNSSISISLGNFKVPSPIGSATGKHGHITWEGDPTLSGGGENLTFNGTSLTDATNPSGNQFNSASNIVSPADTASYGVDFDAYTVTSAMLSPGMTSATAVYSSGSDLVLLSAEIIAVPNVMVSDLSVDIAHVGTFTPGQPGAFTIDVTNNGPSAEPGPISVTIPLPSAFTYASASGTGWSCSASGQTVTCTRSGTLAANTAAGSITLNINVSASASGSVSTSASILGTNFDNDSENSTSTDIYTFTPTPYAYYAMDDASWASSVKDSSGNNRNGTASGSAAPTGYPPASPPSSAITGDPGTCGSGNFPSTGSPFVDTGITIQSNTVGSSGTIAFWYRSANAWDEGNTARMLFDASVNRGNGTADKHFYLVKGRDGRLRFAIEDSSDGDVTPRVASNHASTNFAAGTWHHITVTWNFPSDRAYIYIDGSLAASDTTNRGSSIGNYLNTLYIGAQRSGGISGDPGDYTSNTANGHIDEFRIYSGELTATQIAAVMSSTHPCGGSINHYEVSVPSSGVSCVPTTVTVTACADASSPCTTKATSVDGKTATLATTAGTLGASTITFDATGVASTTLSYPAATDGATATLTLSAEQVTATNGRQCCHGNTCTTANTCDTSFNTAGFIVSATADGAATTIPAQTAGVGSATYYLRAVKTNTTTKACEAALSGSSTVNAAYECVNPATCSATDLMSVNGGSATTVARNNSGSVSSYTSVNMTFDANGAAPFTFNFSDVGSTRLHFAKTVGGASLSGSTGNAFIVKPYGFLVTATCADATANAASQSSPGTGDPKFCRAGQTFSTLVTAINQAGAATPNYGKETTPETVAVAWEKHLPASGNSGTLPSGSLSYSGSGGAFGPTNFTWDEVGILKATASVGDGNYLGAGSASSIAYLGRFYPHHFDVALTPACGGFVYSGRPGTPVVPGQAFTVAATAKSGLGNTTTNYASTGGFAKAVNLSLSAGGGAGKLYVDNTQGGNGAIPATKFAAGIGTVNASDTSGKISYVFDTYPTVATTITVHAEDADTGTSTGTDGSTSARSGRLHVLNAYGSELLPLRVRLQAEYFLGNGRWALNTADTCTSVPTSAVALGNRTPSDIGSSVSSVTAVSGGAWDIVLAKPAKAGSVDLVLNLAGSTAAANACLGSWGNGPTGGGTSAGLEYLASAWCGATYDKIPTARARFGSPRAPFIYLRERY